MKNVSPLQYVKPFNRIELETVSTLGFEDNIFRKTLNFVYKIYDKLTLTYSNILEGINTILHSYNIVQVRELRKFRKRVEKLLNDKTFLDIENKRVPVILGLKQDYDSVNNLLESLGTTLFGGILKELKDMNKVLSNTLSDPEYNKSFKKRYKLYEDLDKTVKDSYKKMNEVFDPDNPIDQKTIGEVFKSKNNIIEVVNNLDNLSDLYDINLLKQIKKEVDVIDTKVRMLVELLEQGKLEFSKESLQSLSFQIGVVGDMVTLVTQSYYIYTQQLGMVSSIEKVLK